MMETIVYLTKEEVNYLAHVLNHDWESIVDNVAFEDELNACLSVMDKLDVRWGHETKEHASSEASEAD